MASLPDVLRVARLKANGLCGASLPVPYEPGRPQYLLDGEPLGTDDMVRVLRQYADREVVFFVHGLMMEESCWQATTFDMGAAFERDFGVLPIHVRYDSARHVSENGRDLAEDLEAVDRALDGAGGRWHVVAHSMGGLVARSALHQATFAEQRFVERVDRVFLLGTPNRGALLEKTVHAATLALEATGGALQATAAGLRGFFHAFGIGPIRPLAPIAWITDAFVHQVPAFWIDLSHGFLELRSDGVRDLRHGYVLEEEWQAPLRANGLLPCRRPVPLPPWVRCYSVAASLGPPTGSTSTPAWATDGLVSPASAANCGPDDLLRFRENGRYRLVSGLSHFAMPRSEAVYAVLREWFEDRA